jgi:hypothetical protein
MTLQAGIALVTDLLIASALSGIVVRRRAASCVSFVAYLSVVLLADLLIWLWPERFFVQNFWLAKETAINLLRFAVALEIAFHTFQAFPGARQVLRNASLLILMATFVIVVAVAPTQNPEYTTLAGKVQPRILNGTIWLFTVIAGLILWYRLPVDPFHKSILTGFVPYLLVFAVAFSALDAYGWTAIAQVNYLDTGAYLLLVAYWTYAAWHPSRVPVQARNVAQAATRSAELTR